MKISEILKKIKEKKKEEASTPETTTPPIQQKPIPQTSPVVSEKPKPPEEEIKITESAPAEIRISSIVMRETKLVSREETIVIYEEVLSLIQEIMKGNSGYEKIKVERISTPVEKMATQLKLGNEVLIELALTRDSLETHYLFCHSVNVCIISLLVGLYLGYDRQKLDELGVSAFLHDVGMINYMLLVNQPRRLTTKESNVIKNHTVFVARVLERIEGIGEISNIVATQHHERLDGSGYPKGLKGEQIHEYAKIVGVVDIYEAMMHPRAYRPELPSLDTIQEILKDKNAYEYKYIKILINKIGIFPIGSLVELNTKEIARVLKLNLHNILRPIVEIIYDNTGAKLNETKILDLVNEPNIWIKKGIKSTEMPPQILYRS